MSLSATRASRTLPAILVASGSKLHRPEGTAVVQDENGTVLGQETPAFQCGLTSGSNQLRRTCSQARTKPSPHSRIQT